MLRVAPDATLVHASSSAVFDPHRYGPYGAAKQYAHEAVIGYRSQLNCSNAILFSHTSPRQDHRFLARRITSTVARIAAGSPDQLVLGDINSRRDWGWAPDYVQALPLIAARTRPADYVIATGRSRSVRELTEVALDAAGLTWDQAVHLDPDAPHVPDEVHPDAQPLRLQASQALGWKPETSFTDMIETMVSTEIAAA